MPLPQTLPRARHGALFGRDEELALLEAKLQAGARMVTLRGPPGVGKTALARAFVTARRGRDARGSVVFVSLASARARSGVLAALARGLGLAPRTADTDVVLDSVARRLLGARAVLVVDGVDALLADLRAVVEDLLSDVPDASVVVCARSRTGSSLEEVIALAPLALGDAATMLTARVKQAFAGRDLPPGTAERLAQWAGGLPLAVEVAASWVATLGAQETLDALGEGRLEQDALDRALDASWDLLAEDERMALARLSAFARTFDVVAASAVLDHPRAVAQLAALASASLLEVLETNDGVRYAMLDGVRAYAAKRASELGAARAALDRLAKHLAESPRPRADRPTSWQRLAEERDDLENAWEHAVTTAGDPELALRLAVVLDPTLSAHGPPDLHLRILEVTVAEAEAKGLPATSRRHAGAVIDLLYARARFSAFRGRHAAAVTPLERGVAIAAANEDAVREAWLRAHLALSLGALGMDASSHLARAEALAGHCRDARLDATIESARADVWSRAGAHDLAADACGRAAAAARVAEAVRLEGAARLREGSVHLARGDVLAAEHALAEARRAFVRVADVFHLARTTVIDALAALHRGDAAAAEERLLGALDDVLLQDDLDGELEARFALWSIARARGDRPLEASRREDVAAACRRAEDVTWSARLALLGHARDDASARIVITLARDGRAFEVDGRAIDFGRRGPLRRVLLALAEHREVAPGHALSVAELREAGWPGERMRVESGASRVYMAVKRLRAVGLEAVLRTSDAGYLLDPSALVRWHPPISPPAPP